MNRAAAFVTGGSSGIGLEIALQLAERGHPVAIFSRDTGRLKAAVEKLNETAPNLPVAPFSVDVGDTEALGRAVGQAVEQLGVPEWAVACAGMVAPGAFLDQDVALHERHLAVNYMGALAFAKAVAGPMSRTGGRLVFVASGAALFGIPGYSAYAPGKFAMRGLAEVLRVELAPQNISVTLAYPPDTDTPMLAAEAVTRPPATAAIAAAGGVWTARAVARLILSRAERGRFIAAPGLQLKLLAALHSLLGPGLRLWQAGVLSRKGMR